MSDHPVHIGKLIGLTGFHPSRFAVQRKSLRRTRLAPGSWLQVDDEMFSTRFSQGFTVGALLW